MGSSNSVMAPNESDETRAEPVPVPHPPISVRINFFAALICISYVLASAFYFYIRITRTLFSGDYAWYSIFILAVEFLGISALLPMAFMLVVTALTNNTPGLPKGPKETPPAHPWFTVRVLIPTYKEGVDVVTPTIDGALNADLPARTRRVVYVCDDGSDPKLQKWVQIRRQTLDNPEDLQYVTGRSKKAGGDKNGKSANLNNCLQSIYSSFKDPTGKFTAESLKKIPLSEVAVVFDCDMVANKRFFLKILEVMADDKLALCLSPQDFSNINESVDIFNNTNRQFWEYILPGSVAAGYIACTGTNFCIRSRALASVGWFPEYTITEDYALGMELACNGYKGSYLNEYIAKGEAPTGIRNVMRQRSRWTKGHMEVFFSSKCPLLNWRLSCINRILYTNGTWAYFVTVITTPIFLAVPLISLVFGIHPVAVSQEFALAAVIYFGLTFLLQMYCRNINHAKSLWFSGVSNHVLCFTYFKAILNILLTKVGLKTPGGFKTTDKGGKGKKSKLVEYLERAAAPVATMARSLTRTFSRRPSRGRDAEIGRGDPGAPRTKAAFQQLPKAGDEEPEEEVEGGWFEYIERIETLDALAIFISFSLSAAAIGLGIYQAVQMGVFEVYTTLPIFWAGYNIVAPALFLWYRFSDVEHINHNMAFSGFCSFMRLFGMLCGIGAMVSLWFAPQPEVNAEEVVRQTGLFLAAHQSGVVELGTDVVAPWVKPSGLLDGAELGLDLSGGFFVDASSNVKFNHPMGIAVSMLAWGFVEFREGVAKAGQEDNYFVFFRHAGKYFSKMWLRGEAAYVTRVGDPEVDGNFLGVPPKDIDAYKTMLRPVYNVSRRKTDEVWGLDAIASGVAALASSAVALELSPLPEDKTLALEFRNTAFEMWETLVYGPSKGRITGTSYCYDPLIDKNICMSTPKNVTGCYIYYRNSTQVDPAPFPPPISPPPAPQREFPPGTLAPEMGTGRRLHSTSAAQPTHDIARRLHSAAYFQRHPTQAPNPDSNTNRKVLQRSGPTPADPVAPVAPVTPVAPVAPADPVAPVNPPITIVLPNPTSPSPPPSPPIPPDSPYPPQPTRCNFSLIFNQDSFFNSTSVYDDAAWAASWLFRAAQSDPSKIPADFSDSADFFLNAHFDFEASWNNASYYITNYNNMQWAASLLQMQNQKKQGIPIKERRAWNFTNTYFRAWLGELKGMKNMDNYDLAVTARTKGGLTWTSNSSLPQVSNTAMMAMQLSKLQTNRFTVKYLRCWARSQLRYILGHPNRLDSNVKKMFKPVEGTSFVTGYGKTYPQNVADRAAACKAEGATCGLNTWSSESPNPNLVPGALVNGPGGAQPDDKFYNNRQDWSNHVGLINNMGFNGLAAAFLDPRTTIDGPKCQEDKGVWDQLFNKVQFD